MCSKIKNQKSITFIDFVLHVKGGQGHVLSYHKSLSSSVINNEWKYVPILSKGAKEFNIPVNWNYKSVRSGVLDYDRKDVIKLVKSAKILPFFTSMFVFGKDVFGVLKEVVNINTGPKIIFLESFNPMEIWAIVVATFFIKRKNLSFWIMYRGSPNWGGKKHRLMSKTYYIFFYSANLFIKLLIGKKRLILLSDSELLSKSLFGYYKQIAHVLPIPHTPTQFKTRVDKISSKIVLWLPGTPRKEKGIDQVKYMTTIVNKYSEKFKLVAAKSSELKTHYKGMLVKLVDDRLSRDEYELSFFTSDFILLFYDKDLYSEATSGIFVESIVSGSIPLVTKGTWMEYELIKYGLSDLVVNCNSSFLLEDIYSIYTSNKVKINLTNMQKEYRSYHSMSSFSDELKKIYNLSYF